MSEHTKNRVLHASPRARLAAFAVALALLAVSAVVWLSPSKAEPTAAPAKSASRSRCEQENAELKAALAARTDEVDNLTSSQQKAAAERAAGAASGKAKAAAEKEAAAASGQQKAATERAKAAETGRLNAAAARSTAAARAQAKAAAERAAAAAKGDAAGRADPCRRCRGRRLPRPGAQAAAAPPAKGADGRRQAHRTAAVRAARTRQAAVRALHPAVAVQLGGVRQRQRDRRRRARRSPATSRAGTDRSAPTRSRAPGRRGCCRCSPGSPARSRRRTTRPSTRTTRCPRSSAGSTTTTCTSTRRTSSPSGLPMAIRLDHEMNGSWYPWGERQCGGNSLNGNGKGDYVKMWRHVHDIFEAEGANAVRHLGLGAEHRQRPARLGQELVLVHEEPLPRRRLRGLGRPVRLLPPAVQGATRRRRSPTRTTSR